MRDTDAPRSTVQRLAVVRFKRLVSELENDLLRSGCFGELEEDDSDDPCDYEGTAEAGAAYRALDVWVKGMSESIRELYSNAKRLGLTATQSKALLVKALQPFRSADVMGVIFERHGPVIEVEIPGERYLLNTDAQILDTLEEYYLRSPDIESSLSEGPTDVGEQERLNLIGALRLRAAEGKTATLEEARVALQYSNVRAVHGYNDLKSAEDHQLVWRKNGLLTAASLIAAYDHRSEMLEVRSGKINPTCAKSAKSTSKI